jgi:chaperone LolA
MSLSSVVLSILLLTVQGEPPLYALMDGVDKRLRTIRDFSADFEQSSNFSSNQTITERGHLKLKREGGARKLRLEYATGDRKVFVSNGKTLTEYTPSIKQAIQEPVNDSDNELIPVMMLLGREDLFQDFPERQSGGENPRVPGHRVVRLVPRDKDQPVVTMEVDPRTSLVHRLALAFPNGDRAQYSFTNIRVDQGVNSSEFEFKAPAGVEVKRQ